MMINVREKNNEENSVFELLMSLWAAEVIDELAYYIHYNNNFIRVSR